MPSSARAGSATTGSAQPAAEERAALSVLGPRELALRARRRQIGRLTAASAAVVVAALLVVGGAQALVAERQVHLDDLQQQLSNAVAANQGLVLNRAALSTPDRILNVAQHKLKMVAPGTVADLTPVNPGPSVAQVAAAASTAPVTK